MKRRRRALLAVIATRPDVVTLDIDMPIMDGVATTQQLRLQHPRLPIVLVIGSESSDRVDTALARWATTYVPKARAADELAQTIRAVLETTLSR